MTDDEDSVTENVYRRTVLGGLAAMGAMATTSGQAAGSSTTAGSLFPGGFDPDTPVATHHPGGPRFVSVDEPLIDPIWIIGADTRGLNAQDPPNWALWEKGRDHLAPRLPELRADPENYDAIDFEWTLVDWPAESGGPTEVVSFSTATADDLGRYDEGRDSVVEFRADAPGDYVLELDAPDGSHTLTVHAFERGDAGGAAVYRGDAWNAPRLSLDAEYDDAAGEFVVETNARPAPDAGSTLDDLWTTFLADDRDPLDTADVEVGDDGLTARIPEEALDGEPGRVHAAVYDYNVWKKSTQDVVELRPDGGVDVPNRPPEWMKEGVMYQIFPRSWAGELDATTFETLMYGDADTGAKGLDYLADLGVDVLWLTPVVPATSVERHVDGELVGGGPHGYDTSAYASISADLVPDGYDDPVEAYRDFVDECHARDIRVCFDLVINHAGRTNDLFQDTIARTEDGPGDWPTVTEWDTGSQFFDWWTRAEVERRNEDGELLEVEPRESGFAALMDMPHLDYANVALREYLLGVADFWSRPQSEGGAGVDGFRADIAWGVPKDFWKELREIVRHNDGEFLMLDETVPRDASYAEGEFDVHHDTADFTNTAHDVAAAAAHGGELFDTIDVRPGIGLPDHSLVLNALENHDEHRILNQAAVDLEDPNHDGISDSTWEYYAARVRGCFAAAITLPGVPHVYYGQERQISRYGEGRHRGDGDPRGYNDDGSIDPSADVREGGRQRAFVNWGQHDEAHRQFYEDLIAFYHEMDVLKPGADFDGVWYDAATDHELLLFERDASHLESVSGPDVVTVVVNFKQDPEVVDLDPSTGTYDYWSGTDVGVDGAADTTTVEVDDLVVLEDHEALEGTYRLVADHSGKVLDVEDVSTADGANVHQWEYVGGDNQHWEVDHVGDGRYRVIAQHSGKVLDVEDVSTDDGANVHQWEDVGGDNQRWYVDEVEAGLYTLTAVHSGKVLDVEAASTNDGANVHQWEDVGADNQHWRLEQI